MINFNTSKQDALLIGAITKRAMGLKIQGYDSMTCNMDLTACHANGSPLDLEELLQADEFNFAHDILGIRRHINRDNGKLENCFLPRFSKILPVS